MRRSHVRMQNERGRTTNTWTVSACRPACAPLPGLCRAAAGLVFLSSCLFFPVGQVHATEWAQGERGYYFDYLTGEGSFLGGSCGTTWLEWNGCLFFSGNDGVHGCEPYVVTDVDAGPVLLKDILIGGPGAGSSPSDFTACGDRVYFLARSNDSVSPGLWATDGTPAGTYKVADINGADDPQIAVPKCIEEILYFDANDGVHGWELWVSDGTDAGTRMLADVNPSGGSNPGIVTSYGDDVIFTANDGTVGKEMFRLTSVAPYFELAVDFLPGAESGSPGYYAPFKNGLILNASMTEGWWEPFFTDGTPAGTYLIKQINDVTEPLYVYDGSHATDFTVINDVVVFAATTNLLGTEPWRTDGTEEGTYLLRDIDPRTFNLIEGSSNPDDFLRYGDYVFFTALDSDRNNGFWQTDGTVEGTVLFPGRPASGIGLDFIEYNGFVYFECIEGFSRMDKSYTVELLVNGHPGSIRACHGGLLMRQTSEDNKGLELGAYNIGPWVESIEPENAGPTDADEVAFLVTFSEPVENVDAADFTLVSEGLWEPAITGVTPEGDGTAWRVAVDTGLGDGMLYLNLVDNGTITDTWYQRFASEADPPEPMPIDGYGTSDGAFAGATGITIDKAAPTVLLTTTAPEPTGLTLVPVAVAFERDVTGFTAEDVAVTNAAVADFAGAGAAYTFNLVPQANGLMTAFIGADAAMDGGSLGNAPSNVLEITYGLEYRVHSADNDRSYTITLQELLRVIQFYNSGGFHCDPGNPEGDYGPGPGVETGCDIHSSDYKPQDWQVTLQELLRLIQFYNFGGYHYCDDAQDEGDGFCTGKPGA